MLQWLRRKLSPWSPEHQRSVAKFPGQAELDPPSPTDLAAMGMTVAFFTTAFTKRKRTGWSLR